MNPFERETLEMELAALEVIARAVDVPANTVARVLYATSVLRNARIDTQRYALPFSAIPAKECASIREMALREHQRSIIHEYMRKGEELWVSIGALMKDREAHVVCDGCPVSILCAGQSLSTPADCVRNGPAMGVDFYNGKPRIKRLGPWAKAMPLRIDGDVVHVDCVRPRGACTISIMDVQS